MSNMKQLSKAPIVGHDLEEYLEGNSSFAFEIGILRLLSEKNLSPLHGGTYNDPITGKARQFDLRCEVRPVSQYIHVKDDFDFRLAIECKCIGENFPLLVQCLPRLDNESFHTVLATTEQGCHVLRLWRRDSRYRDGEPVGKSLAQVGRAKSDNTIEATDSDVFEKWSQCLASARGLSYATPSNLRPTPFFTLVIPIVVVPDGRLWMASYNSAGNRTDSPTAVDQVSYFVGDACKWNHKGELTDFTISHIEIVTKAGLASLIDTLRNPRMTDFFFAERVIQHFINEGPWK